MKFDRRSYWLGVVVGISGMYLSELVRLVLG